MNPMIIFGPFIIILFTICGPLQGGSKRKGKGGNHQSMHITPDQIEMLRQMENLR